MHHSHLYSVGAKNIKDTADALKITKSIGFPVVIKAAYGGGGKGMRVFNNENEIGKVLIDNDYPFALIKFLDENFDEKLEFKTKEASIIIKKPEWIS